MLGERIGPYEIVRLLGEGGMGQVYEGYSAEPERRVAIKLLRAELASDKTMSARFVNEGRAMDIVDHPGVVKVFDIGTLPSGVPYIIMELLAGESLRSRLERGPLGEQTLPLLRKVAQTLAGVHDKKIIHRDLKPENIMLVDDGKTPGGLQPKVLDFGIAKLVADSQGGGQLKTRTGVIIGTTTYMAPEQCGGDGEVCDRSDVYALGCMLYELCAGRPPFVGDQDSQLIGKHLFGTPAPLESLVAGIDPRLSGLAKQMLLKAPLARPTMRQVAARLAELPGSAALGAIDPSVSAAVRTLMVGDQQTAQATPLPRRRPVPRWGLLLVVGLLVAGLGLLLLLRTLPTTTHPPPPAPPSPSPTPPPVEPPPPSRPVESPVAAKPPGREHKPAHSRPPGRSKPGSSVSKPLRNEQVPLFH
jgi:serine/threonine protein kinase